MTNLTESQFNKNIQEEIEKEEEEKWKKEEEGSGSKKDIIIGAGEGQQNPPKQSPPKQSPPKQGSSQQSSSQKNPDIIIASQHIAPQDLTQSQTPVYTTEPMVEDTGTLKRSDDIAADEVKQQQQGPFIAPPEPNPQGAGALGTSKSIKTSEQMTQKEKTAYKNRNIIDQQITGEEDVKSASQQKKQDERKKIINKKLMELREKESGILYNAAPPPGGEENKNLTPGELAVMSIEDQLKKNPAAGLYIGSIGRVINEYNELLKKVLNKTGNKQEDDKNFENLKEFTKHVVRWLFNILYLTGMYNINPLRLDVLYTSSQPLDKMIMAYAANGVGEQKGRIPDTRVVEVAIKKYGYPTLDDVIRAGGFFIPNEQQQRPSPDLSDRKTLNNMYIDLYNKESERRQKKK